MGNLSFVSDACYDRLLDTIYASALDANRGHDFLKQLTEIFGGRALIYRFSKRNHAANDLLLGDFGSFTEAYEQHYRARAVWVTKDKVNREPLVVLSEAIVGEQELLQTEFYNDFLRPQDLRHGLSCHLSVLNDEVIRLGLMRSKRIGAYDQEEQKLIDRLRPHVRRSLEFSNLIKGLEGQVNAGFAALERLGTPALLVDSHGHVHRQNDAADRVLARCSVLGVSHGKLRAEADVREAIQHATGGGRRLAGRHGSVVAVTCRETGHVYSLSVNPVDERDSPVIGRGPLALLLVSSQDQSVRLSEAQVRAAYALTPAEARLAVALCHGESLITYSAKAGVSLTTAKWHLRGIFEKMGERRQVDLVRRLSTDPILRAA